MRRPQRTGCAAAGLPAAVKILLISIQNNLEVIGLKYLHYFLLGNSCDSTLLFLPQYDRNRESSHKNIAAFVRDTAPGLIGVSLMSTEFNNAAHLTRYLKTSFPDIPVVWGGIHPTIEPEESLEFADYVCVGEGEWTMLAMARALESGADLKGINNLCYMDGGVVRNNPLFPLIDNLDDIYPYEHVPGNSFLQDGDSIVTVDKKVFRKYDRYSGTNYNIMSSRGCPFSCTYCCNNFFSKLYGPRKVRRRSIENIIYELERAVVDNPEIAQINFQDDCFLACNDDYLQKFASAYREKIGKPFIVRGIPVFITRAKLETLKTAGISWISLGLQSGSDRTNREIYKRRSTGRDFTAAAKLIREFNIAAMYDVILDNPFENEEDRLHTIRTLMDTPKPFFTQFFSLTFYLGTELYSMLKKADPDVKDDYKEKEYGIYGKTVLNDMTRLAAFLPELPMEKLVHLYETAPGSLSFRARLFALKLYSMLVCEPLTYFRLIKLSQHGSYIKTLRALPGYFREGGRRYMMQLKRKANAAAKETGGSGS